MTSISVALRDLDLGMTIEAGAAARLRRVAGPGGRTVAHAWSWSGSVPAGAGEERRVTLDAPGIYEVELVLPSGHVLTEQHEVAEGEDLRLAFLAEGSRDWFAGSLLPRSAAEAPQEAALPRAAIDDWLLGGGAAEPGTGLLSSLGGSLGVAKGGLVRRSFDARPPMRESVRGWSAPISGSRAGEAGTDGALTAVIATGRRDHGASGWDGVEGLTAGLGEVEVLRTLAAGYDRMVPLPVVRLGGKGDPPCWRLDPSGQPSDARAFAVISTAGGVEVALLPFPWISELGRVSPEIVVTLDDSDVRKAFRTRVMVREGLVGGLLAYLSRGNMHGARTILDDLTSGNVASLVERNDAPLATAAAAYVSLATARESEEGPRDEQLLDLMERHPWLPDGAILFARRKLRFARSDSDIDTARRALKVAYRRGLPFFSAGVENLADALAMAAADDPALEAMGRTVSAARARIDPGQAFTVIRVG